MPKLMIIQAATYHSRADRRPFRIRKLIGVVMPYMRSPRSQADLASWNINLTQRKVALNSDTMNEFCEF